MNDTISRIRLLKRLKHRRDMFCKNRIEFLGLSKNDKARVDEMDACIAEMINAPTIEPERKKGKWIEFPNHYAYKCSECGRIIETVDGKSNVCKHYPYCHCGAKMEEGEQP